MIVEEALSSYSPLNHLDVQDQEHRLQDLLDAQLRGFTLRSAIYEKRIKGAEADAVLFLLAQAFENLAHGAADQALRFAESHTSALDAGAIQNAGDEELNKWLLNNGKSQACGFCARTRRKRSSRH